MNRLPGPLSCGALLLTLAAWWARLGADGEYVEQFFTADVLVWPTVIEDTLVRGHPLWGNWQLTPAPYFFPDALLALLARGLFSTIEARQYATVVLQVLLLAAALGWLVSAVNKALWPIGPAITAVLVSLALTEQAPFVFFLNPSFHVGAVIVTLAAVGIAARQPTGIGWWLALSAAIVAGSASDVLVVIFVLGALALVVAGALSRWGTSGLAMVQRPALFVVGASVAGSVLGRLVPFADRESHGTRFGGLLETLGAAAAQATHFDGRLLLTIALGPPALLFVAKRARSLAARTVALSLLGGTIATVAAVLVSGNLAGGEWHRYLLTPLVGCVVGLVLAIPTEPRQVSIVTAVAVLAAGITTFTTPWSFTFEAPPSRLRAQAACVDALIAREGATGIVTDYWHAKPLALFSNVGASPATFMPHLDRPQVWITSRAWYRPASGFALVIDQGLADGAVAEELGAATTTETCGDWPVHVFRGEARTLLERRVEERVKAEGL